MFKMCYCANGSMSMNIDTKTGYFEIKVYNSCSELIAFKKTRFYKRAMRISDKLMKKYNLS